MVSFIERIRNDFRETAKNERKDSQYKALSRNRVALGEVTDSLRNCSVAEVAQLANRLKHKGQISLKCLRTLKRALIQSEETIAAFIKVNGALQSLVRIISGQNTQFKHEAAGCCCNLALGNPKFCHKLTKIASPYLISSFNGLDTVFLDMCVWTLGNLAASDLKTWSVLKSQGVLPKLTDLLTSPSDNVIEAVVYAICHFVKMGFDNLEPLELTSIAEQVHPLIQNRPDTYWLIFLLSCSPQCDSVFLNNSVVTQVFQLLLVDQSNWNDKSHLKHTTALVRILANLCGERTGQGAQTILCYESTQPSSLQSVFGALLTSPYVHIQQEAYWCIGNICQYSTEEDACNLVTKLQPYLKTDVLKVMQEQSEMSCD